MRQQLSEPLRQSTADYTDVRYEHHDSTHIGYRGRELDQLSTGRYSGGIVRACTKGGWGFATFDALADLPTAISRACESARLMGQSTTQLADAPITADGIRPATLTRDFRGVSLADKLRLTLAYNDLILSTPGIETSRVSYSESFRTVHLATSRGTYIIEERPSVIVYYGATARRGDIVQNAFDSVSSCITYDDVTNQEGKILTAAKRAVALLDAPVVEGGKYSVILNQSLGGVFAHEAFGHLSEADFLYENPKMRDLMHLGRPMGVKQLNIIDDGSMGGTVGSLAFDDEGTPAHKTHLIRDGILAGHLHSLETAAKMSEAPTGNARAIDRTHAPIVRMTNTYIEAGDQTLQHLLAGVDKGLYCCDMFGGQTMMEMFTFSAGYAYRIENGKIGELVRDVVLTGNVFQTLNAIDGFGNDMQIIKRGGGCGKGGQSPLPVTFGSPHLRIHDVAVGGKNRS